MNDEKKPQPPANNPKQLNENYEYAELRQRVNDTDTMTVSFRVPITPSPTRPPDRDKNE